MELVFVVIRMLDNGGTENLGIFSTRELSEEFVNEKKEYEKDEFQIIEVELDKEVIF